MVLAVYVASKDGIWLKSDNSEVRNLFQLCILRLTRKIKLFYMGFLLLAMWVSLLVSMSRNSRTMNYKKELCILLIHQYTDY